MQARKSSALPLMRIIPYFLAASACILLVQCNHVLDPSSRPLTNKDSGRVIGEHHYQVGGRAMIQRRVLVSATPVLETRLYGEPAPEHPMLDRWCRAWFARRDHTYFGNYPVP